MAKKKRSGSGSTPKRSKNESPGTSSVTLPLALGVVLGVLLTLGFQAFRGDGTPPGPGGSEAGPASPLETDIPPDMEVDPDGFDRLRAQIEATLDAMPAEMLPAEDPERQILFPHPRGERWLLALGRARPDDRDRWTVAFVRAGKGPLSGERPEEGLAIDGTFDLPGAQGIEGAAFNEFGSVAVLLTRADSRARGPGDLYRLVPGENHARRIDRAVFRFSMAPDGDAVVYERALDPEKPLGERELKIFHSSRGETTPVRSFDYPREQLGELGPWGPGGVYLELTVERYGSSGFRPEAITHYTLDPFNPSNFTPVRVPGAAGAESETPDLALPDPPPAPPGTPPEE